MFFITELKRRNVFRVGAAYGIVAWLLVEVASVVLPALRLPEWTLTLLVFLVVAGFPLALILAWAFELTPEGIRREKDVDRSTPITHKTGRKLDRITIGFLVIAVGLLLMDRFTGQNAPTSEPVGGRSAADSRAERAPTTSESVGGRLAADSAANELTTTEKSIAVLPFVNMSSDPEQEYFSDGLAEELLNRLAQNDTLRVAARTSAFQFKGQNLDVAEIGRQLKVENVLEGSVRKAGNRLRITAQLINVEDGFHIWSETYEREMDDIFAIQDEISGAISTALELELGTTATAAAAVPTQNLEAYNLYLRGRYLLAARGGENMLEADKLFERTVALDPDFSAAWSAMAFNSAVMHGYTYEIPSNIVYEKAVRAARRAIELDPENAEAYIALGMVEIYFGHHWQAGQAAANRAYELAPNNAEVVNIFGDILIMLGDFEAAERIERKAAMLDPLSATNATDVAFLLLMLNRPAEALEPARTAMDLAPDSYYRVEPLIKALLQAGKIEEGKALIEQTVERMNVEQQDPAAVTNWWARYFYEKNDAEGLRAYLSERLATTNSPGADSESSANKTHASIMAFFQLWLGGADAALPWLQQARASEDWTLVWPEWFYLPERMSTDPAWLEFWNQPEYQELFDIRRSHPYEHVSYWKDRPAP